jgi:plastocyanin
MTQLMGKIAFEGTPPPAKPIPMKADPNCPQTGDAKTQEVVVSDGGLENVIVYISSGAEGKGGAASSEPQLVEQTGCRYLPHVFSVQTGQPVLIRNNDATNHNIHTLSEKNPTINFAQSGAGLERTEKFTKVETFRVKCDIHPWMGAFVGVFDHPFHAVSGTGGEYAIKLPSGSYEVTAWHEKYGKQTMTVEIKDGAAMEHLNFTFKADAKSGD